MTRRPAHSVGVGRAGRGAPALAAWLAVLLFCIAGCDRGTENASTEPHPTTNQAPQTLAPPRPKVIQAVAAAPRPTGPLPTGTSCVTAECHATFATSAQIHAPVAENACDACHAPDAGGHTYPLLRGGTDANCTFCHAVSGRQEHQHAALEQGCTTCHDPHASQAKFLLNAPNVTMLCAGCHDASLKRFAHQPFIEGDCTACHQPHEANNPGLLRGGPVPEHCFQCHDDVQQKVAVSNNVHDPARNDCKACHEPHTSANRALLIQPAEETCFGCHAEVQAELHAKRVKHGAIEGEQGCAGCHDPHASDSALLLRGGGRMSDVCLTCHAGDMKTDDGRVLAGMSRVLNGSKYLHGAIKQGDCSGCHAGHAADRPMLLTGAFPATTYARFEVEKYGLCFENCHSPQLVLTPQTASLTNFRDGTTNLHFLHVNRDDKGRSCSTCHAVHGSDLPNHMATQVPFERSGWAMPIGFQKQEQGGSCAPGCHAPRTYVRSPTTVPTTQAAASGDSR